MKNKSIPLQPHPACIPHLHGAVLVGLSGGRDSVALLHVLLQQGCCVHACHVHHGIRGADADADADFCRTLCERLGIAPEDVCAVGDNGNDVSMITHVGLGVAMANGMDETKAAARVVTDLPNGQEGFADFIEKTFLGL